MVKENFVQLFEDSFRQNWDYPAYTDYETKYEMTYAQVAEQIEKLHLLFEQCGLQRNDKVSLIGRNSAHWAVAYVATITYGAVIVPILQDFKANDVHHIVKHSDSKLLFTADYIWDHLDENELGAVRAVVSLTKFKPLAVISSALPVIDEESGLRMQLSAEMISPEAIQQLFDRKYKGAFTRDKISYYHKDNEEVASINYTSGTTGFSKGVMTTGRALASNAVFGHNAYALHSNKKLLFRGDRMVTFLPLAHAYGCAFDFLGNTTTGGHTYSALGCFCRDQTDPYPQCASHHREDLSQADTTDDSQTAYELGAQGAFPRLCGAHSDKQETRRSLRRRLRRGDSRRSGYECRSGGFLPQA